MTHIKLTLPYNTKTHLVMLNLVQHCHEEAEFQDGVSIEGAAEYRFVALRLEAALHDAAGDEHRRPTVPELPASPDQPERPTVRIPKQVWIPGEGLKDTK